MCVSGGQGNVEVVLGLCTVSKGSGIGLSWGRLGIVDLY